MILGSPGLVSVKAIGLIVKLCDFVCIQLYASVVKGSLIHSLFMPQIWSTKVGQHRHSQGNRWQLAGIAFYLAG